MLALAKQVQITLAVTLPSFCGYPEFMHMYAHAREKVIFKKYTLGQT